MKLMKLSLKKLFELLLVLFGKGKIMQETMSFFGFLLGPI